MRSVAASALVLFMAACTPAASSPSPSPSTTTSSAPTATAAPTASPTPSPAATPTGTPIAQPTGANLSAPSGDVVWVLVGGTRLFRSSDRGATWQERGIPPSVPIGDIAFINDREGWLASTGSPATQCQSQSIAIYHTSDAAATWDRVYQSDGTGDALCKESLYFADAQRGFLSLWSPNSNAVIARTLDGGKTWTRSAPLADPPGFTSSGAGAALRAGRAKAFGTTIVVSALGIGISNSKDYAYRSTDGGATWAYASATPQPLIEMVFVTASRWLQIFLPNQSSETLDAGASWHAFTTDYQQAAPVSPQIVFGDANVGYATVRGSIQRTTDGGAHWPPGVKTPGT